MTFKISRPGSYFDSSISLLLRQSLCHWAIYYSISPYSVQLGLPDWTFIFEYYNASVPLELSHLSSLGSARTLKAHWFIPLLKSVSLFWTEKISRAHQDSILILPPSSRQSLCHWIICCPISSYSLQLGPPNWTFISECHNTSLSFLLELSHPSSLDSSKILKACRFFLNKEKKTRMRS